MERNDVDISQQFYLDIPEAGKEFIHSFSTYILVIKLQNLQLPNNVIIAFHHHNWDCYDWNIALTVICC
jgi:hypothetical protein